MGITRSRLHKKRPTGGKRHIHRKKRKFELGRPPAATKLTPGERRVRPVRVRGGHTKWRALRLDRGNFAWGSEAIARYTRILDVVYNSTNNELVRTKTLVKGCIVSIDGAPFRNWYYKFYGVHLGTKVGGKKKRKGGKGKRSVQPKKGSSTVKQTADSGKQAGKGKTADSGKKGAADKGKKTADSGKKGGDKGKTADSGKKGAEKAKKDDKTKKADSGKKQADSGKKQVAAKQTSDKAAKGSTDKKKSTDKKPSTDKKVAGKKASTTSDKKKSSTKKKSSKKRQGPSKDKLRRWKKRQKGRSLDAGLLTQFESGTGRLLARLSSSPGQVGRADGYLLEGKELEFYQKRLDKKKKKA